MRAWICAKPNERSQIDAVMRYSQDRQLNHARRTFRGEWIEFLRQFEVEGDYDVRQLFKAG